MKYTLFARVIAICTLGMHDNLTNYLVDRTVSSSPFVIKYVPYGSLTEVCARATV